VTQASSTVAFYCFFLFFFWGGGGGGGGGILFLVYYYYLPKDHRTSLTDALLHFDDYHYNLIDILHDEAKQAECRENCTALNILQVAKTLFNWVSVDMPMYFSVFAGYNVG
jgi:hypothetical protein